MEDIQIIDLYLARDGQAIQAAADTYGAYCRAIARNVLRRESDADDCARLALQRAWEAIPHERPVSLKLFLVRETRDLSMRRRYDGAELPASGGDREEIAALVNRFLDKQSKTDRIIFIRCYWYALTDAQIAEEMGLSRETVSLRISRIRERLRKILAKRGVSNVREFHIFGYADGIGDELLLEAEPASLVALIPREASSAPPVRRGRKSPRRHGKGKAAAVAAAILLCMGLSFGVCMGAVSVLMGDSDTDASFLNRFLGGLLSSLDLNATEPPAEDTAWEAESSTSPEETTETLCGGEHGWVLSNQPAPTACYTDEAVELTCAQCGSTREAPRGEHVFRDGYCQICHLVEGAFDGCMVEVKIKNGQPEGIINGHDGIPDGTDLILPNVCYREEYGLVPVTEVRLIELHRLPVTRVVIPEGIRTIGAHALDDSILVTEIFLPDSVEVIGDGAFRGNTALSQVRMSEGLRRMGSECFAKCVSLTEIVLPPTLESMGINCFVDCTALTKATIQGNLTELGANTFMRCTALTSVSLSDSITVIGSGAFYQCENLTALDIPPALTSVGGVAFEDSGVRKLSFPGTVTKVGNGAFRNCALTEVHFAASDVPHTVVFGTEVFIGCNWLKEVTLPEGLTELPTHTFYLCSSLRSLYIPDGVTAIGSSAMGGCSALKSLRLPAELTGIGVYALGVSNTFSELTMPEGGLYYRVQDGCLIERATGTVLIGTCDAVIPNDGSIVAIEEYAFRGRRITQVVIPEGVTTIGHLAFSGSSLKSVEFPSTLTYIGDGAFSGTLLTEVSIPEGCTEMIDNTFSNCDALTKVFLPSSLKYVDSRVFGGCDRLSEIHYNGTVAEWAAYLGRHIPSESVTYRIICTDGTV